MPDITMCSGDGCPIRKMCYRFTAIPNNMYQSFFTRAPYNKNTKKCTEYWEVIDVKKKNKPGPKVRVQG